MRAEGTERRWNGRGERPRDADKNRQKEKGNLQDGEFPRLEREDGE